MLVSLDSFKTYAGITGTTDDSKLTALILGVSDVISRRCHRRFEYGSYSEQFDIWDFYQDTIQIRNFPIVSVVALTDNGTAVASTKYNVHREAGIIELKEREYISQYYRRDEYFTKGKHMVDVTYWGGWQDIPDALQLVTKMVTNRLYKKVNKEEMKAEQIGDYRYEKGLANKGFSFLPEEEMILSLFAPIT